MDQLVLNYNSLTALNAKWFKGLNNLHDLKLCNNQIATIDDDAFDGLEGRLNYLLKVAHHLQNKFQLTARNNIFNILSMNKFLFDLRIANFIFLNESLF